MDAKNTEETRIALVGIIVEDMEQTEKINQILHIYGSYIIGRGGGPPTAGGNDHQYCSGCA